MGIDGRERGYETKPMEIFQFLYLAFQVSLENSLVDPFMRRTI